MSKPYSITRSSAEIVEAARRTIGDDIANDIDQLLDDRGRVVDPMLSRDMVARALGISMDSLERMHARGEGPPRFKVTPKRYGYPARAFREWQRAQLKATMK